MNKSLQMVFKITVFILYSNKDYLSIDKCCLGNFFVALYQNRDIKSIIYTLEHCIFMNFQC